MKIFPSDDYREIVKFSIENKCDLIAFHAGSISKVIALAGKALEDLSKEFEEKLDEIQSDKLMLGQRFYTVLVEGLNDSHVEAQVLMTMLASNEPNTAPTLVDALRGAEDITRVVQFKD
jgi:hypothetical protein